MRKSRRMRDALLLAGDRALDAVAGIEGMQLVRDLRAGYLTGALNPMPAANLVPGATFVETHPPSVTRLGPPPRPLDASYPYDVASDGVVEFGRHGYWRLPGASWYPDYGLVVGGERLEMVEGSFRFPVRYARVNDTRFRRASVVRLPGVAVPLETEWVNNHYHNLLDHGPRMAVLAHPTLAQFDEISLLTYTMRDNPVLQMLADRLLPPNVRVVEVDPKTLVRPDELLMPLPPMPAFAAVPPSWYVKTLRSRVTTFRGGHVDRMVYISRAGARRRAILNEDELVDHLAGRGFEIVRTERLAPEAVVDLMGQTSVLVGQLGAGLANALYCPAGSAIVELAPESTWTGEFFWLAHGLGLSFSTVSGRSRGGRRSPLRDHRDEQFRHDFYRKRDADIVIDIAKVDEAIDRTLSKRPSHSPERAAVA